MDEKRKEIMRISGGKLKLHFPETTLIISYHMILYIHFILFLQAFSANLFVVVVTKNRIDLDATVIFSAGYN